MNQAISTSFTFYTEDTKTHWLQSAHDFILETAKGDCHYTDLISADNSSGNWQVSILETTNHEAPPFNTVPAGNIQYFGISNQRLNSNFDYVYIQDEYNRHASKLVGNTTYIDSVVIEEARTRWFDAVSDLSGILHAFCCNETDNRFSYMTNGP